MPCWWACISPQHIDYCFHRFLFVFIVFQVSGIHRTCSFDMICDTASSDNSFVLRDMRVVPWASGISLHQLNKFELRFQSKGLKGWGDQVARLLRVPFMKEDGSDLPHWISRSVISTFQTLFWFAIQARYVVFNLQKLEERFDDSLEPNVVFIRSAVFSAMLSKNQPFRLSLTLSEWRLGCLLMHLKHNCIS